MAKLCEGLVTMGNDVDVYTTTANGKTELDVGIGRPVNIEGVLVTYFERITKDPTHISFSLWRRLNKTVTLYDVVHIQSWWNPLVIGASYICYKKGVRFIISPRGMLSEYIINAGNSFVKKLIHTAVGKFVLSKSHFHATARAEYNECVKLIPGWNGFVLPNILSLPETEFQMIDNKVFTMIFMSRIHPKKGLELLFNVISTLNFKVLLKIAGSGDDIYIRELKALADSLKISSSIQWLGWTKRDEKFKELMNADLFVLTSYNENFANVVIEALHMGTPVLVSENVALSDFVREKDLGWITTLDILDIKNHLEQAYINIEKRKAVRKMGRAVIKDVFDEKKLINDYVGAYKSIVF